MAKPPPDLKIPHSTNTVSVRIINTTSQIGGIPLEPFVSPQIPGFTHLSCPAYSFLIEHPTHPTRSLLFDLGVRKDWQNLAPAITNRIKNGGWSVSVQKGVREQLEDHGVDVSSIEGIIWSHWHWDHTGDPSTFPTSTSLIVGPGFKSAFVPGYPSNQESPVLESDYNGRELREISFDGEALKIGRFNAFDYFGDGSFYLLDSPGHAIGHMCALARITTGAGSDSFVFMGGDACHHGGEFRPSPYLPLPSSILPNPFDVKSSMPCPGSMFDAILRDGDSTKPFYEIARPEDGSGVANNADDAEETIEKIMEVDARAEVLVAMAHDDTLLDVVDFFPKYISEFKEKGWVQKARWLFLRDFIKAVKGGRNE